MNRVYLFSYSLGMAEKARAWVDSSPLVVTWRSELPLTYFIVSEASAHELSADLEGSTTSLLPRYLISEITDNRQGRLSVESWFLAHFKRLKTEAEGGRQ